MPHLTSHLSPLTSAKARILNRKQLDQLFFHIIDGFSVTRQGIKQCLKDGSIKIEEYLHITELNQDRLLARINEFRLTNRLLSVIFASLFAYMQVIGGDADLRKPARTRIRRRNESVQVFNLN